MSKQLAPIFFVLLFIAFILAILVLEVGRLVDLAGALKP